MAARDPRKLERLRQAIAHDLVVAQRYAAKHVLEFVKGEAEDSKLPWSEVHGATRGALSLVQASLAAERAKDTARTPVALGLVFMQPRLEDTPENRQLWEADARAQAIEAVAVPVPVEVKSG